MLDACTVDHILLGTTIVFCFYPNKNLSHQYDFKDAVPLLWLYNY